MKQIPTSELKEGDIFAFQIKLKERVAYLVESNEKGILTYSKRNATTFDLPKKLNSTGYVIKLK